MTALVELRKITKDFSGVKALDGVDIKIHAGEVLALVGENGAGKSTLMKVLSGVYPQSSFSGEVLLAGRVRKFYAPADAEREGIAIIHQELSNFDHLSVAENLFVGRWPLNATGIVDWNRLNREAETWLKRVGLRVDPMAKMQDLSVGAQQLVEIAKALAREGSVIILDEPTSALTDQEVERLFSLVRDLKKENKAIVYISHKMDEIYSLSDRITVLRDGKTVHSEATKTLERDRLIALMVGREINQLYPPVPERELGKPVLSVENLSASHQGKDRFGPLSFSLRAGEILGFAGLLGSGRSELLRTIAGDPAFSAKGKIIVNGRELRFSSPRDSIKNGVFYVSEDRKAESILANRPIGENEGVSRVMKNSLLAILRESREEKKASGALRRFRTKYASLDQEIASLSGGNQQKVILARALSTMPEVILLDEPTRGVDVGAKFEIYEILFELARTGKALVIVSSELPELMALADRIQVLAQGQSRGELARADFSQTAIMRLAVQGAAKGQSNENLSA